MPTLNKLPRAITAQLFQSTEDYQALRRHWSALLSSPRRHELTAAHHLLYLALLGRDWRKAFTPISNPHKLANGTFRDRGLFVAMRLLCRRGDDDWLLAPFEGLVTSEMIELVRAKMPQASIYQAHQTEQTYQGWAFPAYFVSEALTTLVAPKEQPQV